MRVGLCVPTLNAGDRWNEQIARISTSVPDGRVLIVDSSSSDDTSGLAKRAGFEVVSIPRSAFNHGGTRQLAVELLHDCHAIVFLTQDACVASADSLRNLLAAFDDPKVGAAYGRQLPHEGATPCGAHARLFNYPAQSDVTDISTGVSRGIKAPFMSNVFGAYRREALAAVGGFPLNVILFEDMAVAARMLLAGWKISYRADAMVHHSHEYSVLREFRRYFDIGVFFAREPWIAASFGEPEGEGMRFVISELRYLVDKAPRRIPESVVRNLLKYLGYRLGRLEARLPLRVKRSLSMHTHYWSQ